MTKTRIITSCTRDCPNTCGLVATVEDGRLVGLTGNPDHPLTSGVACHKTGKYIRRVYSPERITHPMVRKNGQWERVSWDEALDLVADTMKTVCEESGPEAILYYQGYGERTALKLLNKYFFNLLGGATTMYGSLCGGAGQGSQNLDFGERVSHDPLDHLNSNSIVLWARNPVSTNISLVPIIRKVKKRGGKVIVIDPAKSKSVALADHHIKPRPGGDGYLAMAATKLILAAGAEDREFLEKYSEGVEEYLAILERYSVEELCSLAGVPTSDALILANTFMKHGPTSTLLGWGLHRYEYAHHSIRPIDALGAVSGNIGVPGGGVSQGFEEYGPYDSQWWGDGLNPPRRQFLIPKVGEEILNAKNPAVRLIYVTAGNPLCMAPNSSRIAEAFGRAELVVYSGHFMDDTADLADVFLPATTFLEEDDVVASYGHNYVGPVNRAIEPVGECKSEFHMFYELASRFPFADWYRRPVDEWLQRICSPIWQQGGDLESLRREAFRLDAPMVPYEDKTFPTESGRFRFMTEFDPEHTAGDNAYPYKLLTIAPHGTICSERTVAEHEPLPVVTLNAQEAERGGMRDGMIVLVKSPVGEVRARLRADADMRRDVLVAERGGWTKAGHGLNLLTLDMASKVGNGTPFYETSVAVSPEPEVKARILLVQNSGRAPGGTFHKALERGGASLMLVRPADGESLPELPDAFDGLVVLGGPQHAFDDDASPYFPALMRLMREFDEAGKPVAGICLGAQLLARAHGARTWGMDALEFGFVRHALTPEGEADPLFMGIGELPGLMEFHEDSFDLPDGAGLLVQGDACANQCFRVGRVSYGFQFHLEVDSAVVENWINLFKRGEIDTYAEYKKLYGPAFFEAMEADLPLLVARSEDFCNRVAANWLKLVVG
ncbi:molybdopterin-dependent oxidoreductase [Pseudodesulfovibrio cashew]|uniref:Molybdopterin-dependent oxidoreductase n=1 Tax=Pseudodesulfovibrio cashew TaxID=2678688 RepID=A0A6I6JHB3_9BACT|nr:molybdopterin-dependent oxidoreductase [Pseudodesulfovibrio cashew]QGY40559.1 molybdopterin-dependent oxidoreductase [Pseudodesulfovibrio cashew]